MVFSDFYFAQGVWLWGLLAIPLVLLLYAVFYRTKGAQLLERFADQHLLPYLVKKRGAARRTFRAPLLLWALAWLCGMVAMAGPRWNYTDEQTFQGAQNLVVVLDLSQTMNAVDVKPSRVARAREEIEDLLDMSRGASIGLVAYAAVPHMVTPLTDDVRTIRNLLPALDTSLVTIQGDRLKPALEMAAGMLKAEPGQSKSILVVSDGDFEENDFAGLARAAGNTTIFTMGIGAAQTSSNVSDPLQEMPPAPLKADRLQSLAAAGHGLYVEANYTDSDTRAILDRMESGSGKAQTTPKTVRVWEERFYIPALALALLLLPLFRKGASFLFAALLAMTIFTTGQLQAATAGDLFFNEEQQARAVYDKGDYKGAMAKFDTPYRRGVAAYRAGAYDKAAILFKAAARKNNLDALYNLGNAQLMQGQINDAIADYEAVLKQRPGDADARHNLDIALKMPAQNKQQQPQRNPPQDNKDKQGNGGGQNNPQGRPPQQGKNAKQANQDQTPSQPGQPRAGQQGQSPQDRTRQDKAQQAQSQQAKSQQAQQKPEQLQPGKPPQNIQAGAAPVRTQRDVHADEWLGRVQSDPGSFLKNQFMIEDRESALQQGAPP
jgi:Ca-activated chloride channel family protein